jgi:hypothetical protein
MSIDWVAEVICVNLILARFLFDFERMGEKVDKHNKRNYRDVFHAYLVQDAEFVGEWDMPLVRSSERLPEQLIPFDQFKVGCHLDKWVHFYIHDCQFERVWKRPKYYFEKLKHCQGLISTDFSLYTNMPLAQQLWNTYRNRVLASWFQRNGVEVIPNVRWGNERSYDFCFDGIEPRKTVAIGTHGCIKKNQDKLDFQRGLEVMIERLYPKTIIVYGKASETIFAPCIQMGIRLIQFDSVFHTSRQKDGE